MSPPAPRLIVLASTSRYRRELLDRLRLPYLAVAPPFDEVVDPSADPVTQIEAFALGKASAVAPLHPDALIIGSDQGLVAGPDLLGKPGTAAGACAQLARLAGGTHRLVTAVCVLDAATGQHRLATEVHQLAFRALSAQQLETYVALDDPVDCAGSFRLESLGVALFDRIDGSDPTGIIGLPLIRLVALLHSFGVDVLAPSAHRPPAG